MMAVTKWIAQKFFTSLYANLVWWLWLYWIVDESKEIMGSEIISLFLSLHPLFRILKSPSNQRASLHISTRKSKIFVLIHPVEMKYFWRSNGRSCHLFWFYDDLQEKSVFCHFANNFLHEKKEKKKLWPRWGSNPRSSESQFVMLSTTPPGKSLSNEDTTDLNITYAWADSAHGR